MEEQRQAESSDFASYGQRIRCCRLNEDVQMETFPCHSMK